MKPVIESRFKAKRHRGPHKWSPWWWAGRGQIRWRECLIDGCYAHQQGGLDGKLKKIRPELWNSGKWKKRPKKK